MTMAKPRRRVRPSLNRDCGDLIVLPPGPHDQRNVPSGRNADGMLDSNRRETVYEAVEPAYSLVGRTCMVGGTVFEMWLGSL